MKVFEAQYLEILVFQSLTSICRDLLRFEIFRQRNRVSVAFWYPSVFLLHLQPLHEKSAINLSFARQWLLKTMLSETTEIQYLQDSPDY